MFPLVVQSRSEEVVKGFVILEVDAGGSLGRAQSQLKLPNDGSWSGQRNPLLQGTQKS